MAEFFYRTEDIKPEEVASYFASTARDREIIQLLKGRSPVVLAGSRGVGKSFLMRMAETELNQEFAERRALPVYTTFSRSSLINTSDPQQFQHWMLARICSRIQRALQQRGLAENSGVGIGALTGGVGSRPERTKIEELADLYEESWQATPGGVDSSPLPSLDLLRDALEDICEKEKLTRIVVFIDEAAHILLPEQQRQFFTLFRDLRSPFLVCKAAVYPGVTSYGDTFQPSHDATMVSFDRDILSSDYVATMREIVEKQAESGMLEAITRQDKNFSLLAFAASGNPRVLLKTLSRTGDLSGKRVNEVVREYYRNDLWAEHSTLPQKYSGHQHLIDWGRRFIEGTVLPDLEKKNKQYLGTERNSSCFFWIHRDAPQPVKEALKLLAYSGIVSEHGTGIRATRSEVGTRYSVNLGGLIALEANPTTTGLSIARNLDPRRMSEFGANHAAYENLLASVPTFSEPNPGAVLQHQLSKDLSVLDITDWQKDRLGELGLSSVGDVLRATETQLQQLAYVGEKRSRRIRNAALAAVLEYLSG